MGVCFADGGGLDDGAGVDGVSLRLAVVGLDGSLGVGQGSGAGGGLGGDGSGCPGDGASGAGGEAGFTLFEVMVAFVIAALALSVLFAGGLAGLRTARIADGYDDALSRARSRIAAIVSPQPLDTQGDDGGGYHFHLRIVSQGVVTPGREQDVPTGAQGTPNRVGLYGISVVVSWKADGGTRQVELDTQGLGEVAPAPP